MDFDSIIGNTSVKQALLKALKEKKVPNTMLFSGPDGIGKSLFALNLALQLMYPEDTTDQKSRLIKETHPDFHVFKLDDKTNTHSISSIRFLIDEVHKPPFEAKAKVFVFHDAEKMLPSSANALLKTLEEPTLDSYIILLTSRQSDLLATISSRCTKFRFSSLSEEEVFQYIEKRWEKSETMSRYFAKLSHGSIGKAAEMIAHPESEQRSELILEILAKNKISTYSHLLKHLQKLEKLIDGSQSAIDTFFSFILMWFRDLHLIQYDPNSHHLFFSEMFKEISQIKDQKIPSLEIVHHYLQKVRDEIDRNMKLSNSMLQFFMNIQWI